MFVIIYKILRLIQIKQIRLVHNINLFIILYDHYLSKKKKKKPSAKVKISNLINYSAFCCQNDKDTMICKIVPIPILKIFVTRINKTIFSSLE